MNYKDALASVYSTNQSSKVLDNPFLFYSMLSDLTAGDYHAGELTSTFYKVSKVMNVFHLIDERGIRDSLTLLKEAYKKGRIKTDKHLFKECIVGIVTLFDPNFFKPKEKVAEKSAVPDAGKPKKHLVKESGGVFSGKKPIALNFKQGSRVNFIVNGAGVFLTCCPTEYMKIHGLSNLLNRKIKYSISKDVNSGDIYVRITSYNNGSNAVPYISLSVNSDNLKELTVKSDERISSSGEGKNVALFSAKSITASGTYSDLNLVGDKSISYSGNVDSLYASSKDGSVKCSGNFNDITVKTTDGDISFSGNAKNIFCGTVSGRLNIIAPSCLYTQSTIVKGKYTFHKYHAR